MRRHGGTIVMAYGFKRRDFKKMRALLAAAGIFVPDMTRLKRCGLFGGAMSKRERLRRAKKKYSVYPIGDGEKKRKKARSSDKKGAHDGTRTHVGMSKRLDLHSKEQESTSHQAALVIGGINLINTRTYIGNMQGGETRRSERENAQRHGCNSESERRSRRVAGISISNGQRAAGSAVLCSARSAPHGQIWPSKRRGIAVSHRRCATDQKKDRAAEGTQGAATHGREEQPTRRENGHAKRHWGRDCQCTWRHLIRKPAKPTGTRHEICTWGEPTRPGVGSPSRKRHTQCVKHNRKGHCGNKSENREGTNNGGAAVS
jgi:hypothetical protein